MTNTKATLKKIKSDLKKGFYLPERSRYCIGDDIHFLCTLPQAEWCRSKPAELVRGILVAMIENIEIEGDIKATATEHEISYYVKLADKTREMTFGLDIDSEIPAERKKLVTTLKEAKATTLDNHYNLLLRLATELSGLLRPGTTGPTAILPEEPVTKVKVGGSNGN